MNEHSGRCLCGATRFTVTGPLDEAALCHCSMCRHGTGAAFNVAVPVEEERVTWQARDSVREFQSSPGKARGFCSGCGAAIYSRADAKPGWLRLRGGVIEGFDERPAKLIHIFRDSRWPWIDGIEEAEKFPEREPGR